MMNDVESSASWQVTSKVARNTRTSKCPTYGKCLRTGRPTPECKHFDRITSTRLTASQDRLYGLRWCALCVQSLHSNNHQEPWLHLNSRPALVRTTLCSCGSRDNLHRLASRQDPEARNHQHGDGVLRSGRLLNADLNQKSSRSIRRGLYWCAGYLPLHSEHNYLGSKQLRRSIRKGCRAGIHHRMG